MDERDMTPQERREDRADARRAQRMYKQALVASPAEQQRHTLGALLERLAAAPVRCDPRMRHCANPAHCHDQPG